jgi:hypothetical protein
MKGRISATFLAGLAIAMLVAATPPDSAVIVNSGSTNTSGYAIQVSSEGKASVTIQNRGTATGTPKPFTVSTETTARFFSDLAAARKANAVTVPCMKSASFGTSEHVKWQGWVSPDLTCPPKDSVGEALVKVVDEIRQAAGVSTNPLIQR